ncbi:MAG: PP2C family protein-serine/threonine phosphatase [Lachnospiraceae bacterium]|nr:PP2C family protein-serine/threonine phosphatase [Lachnospiraceae bacterium]
MNNSAHIRKKSLITSFVIMFSIYAFITIVINAVFTYVNQTEAYHTECENNLKELNGYVGSQMRREGIKFSEFKDYYSEHSQDMLIPYDYSGDYEALKKEFEVIFSRKYPGKVYGKDIVFDDLDEELKLQYAEYEYAYWLTMLEDARDSFGLSYAYFVYPVDDLNVCYMIDAIRGKKTIDGKDYLTLGDVVETDHAKHEVLWETWETGTEPDRFDSFDNEYGHTYAFYTPLVINGEKIGLICSEVSVLSVNRAIITAVVRHFLGSVIVMLLGIFVMIVLIRKNFLLRIINLEGSVVKYSHDKDDTVAEEIRHNESGNDEIRSLSDQFADMILELRDYMIDLQHVTAEKERIGAELNVATKIQADMLPRKFPPFPERREFDLYATMDPAKEVGGDFYDFFMIDDDHIALVMADVSGKGVPAALFMVISKTLIKTRTLQGGLPGEILEDVNDQLCEGNEAELFVTVWLAIVELSTGKGWAANAGHEHPAIKRKDGSFELSIYKHSPAVATMEGIPFKQHEFELEPGDSIYVYTDGVAEATNTENELYGTDRMLDVLNRSDPENLEKTLEAIRTDIDDFVGDAEQFDDITMLLFNYYGPRTGE